MCRSCGFSSRCQGSCQKRSGRLKWGSSANRSARRRVLSRDKGVCAACGEDTEALRKQRLNDIWGWNARVRGLGYNPQQSLWEMDHMTPLVDGGSSGMDNLQTLCQPCHLIKTMAENRGREQARREQACR